MKSFKNFVHIVEVKQKTRINISGPEILPMQPEAETTTKKSKVVKQSEVSADIKAKVADKKKIEAIKKGYVSPEGRVQEKGVVINRIRADALGYGDKGKDPTKYGIRPDTVAQEKSSLFKRAVDPSKSVRKSARKEIRTAISSIEKRYPGSTERTGTSFRGFSRSVGYTPSKIDISILQRMARPETSGQAAKRLSSQLGQGAVNRGQAAADAARDIVAEPERQAQKANKRLINKTKAFSDLQSAIDKSDVKLPQPRITKAQVQPKTSKPRVTSSSRTQSWQGPALAPAKPETVKKVEQGLQNAKLNYPKDSSGARKLVRFKQFGRALGRVAGPAFAAYDAYGTYKSERERGQTKERATKAAIAKAGGGWAGSAAGAAAGAKLGGAIGTLAGPVGTAVGAGIGGLAGGIAGYMGGEKVGSAVLGASQKDKDWMKWANRKNQAGTSAANTTFKSGNTGIIKDASGKERVGYKAFKDGKEVYKHANDPKSLQYTSSNPLERIGRTFFPGAYTASDEAARKKKVAAVKAALSK